ncbi:putative uncharacterized protein [Mycolicibacterium thermoresistibile]|nr:hypothetical protein [Mycolicibacterium thermoresistibile]MCV7187010.1 hypothetical protein [Mycolicibacterium thermoresistibile]GAT13185.1 putative uncharacterized protein [Mycolicibacterium thermoresistibile]
MLTLDQRWLLMTMGGWQIVDALIGPGGVSHLMQSRWGGFRQKPIPGAPAWMTSWFTGNGRIVSPYGRGVEPRVAVTAAQIDRYATTIPDEIKDQLRDIRAQSTANAVLRGRFCGCGSKPCGYAYMGDRICPPTERQESDARADYLRIRAYEKVYLAKALRLTAHDLEPSGQLDLFEAAL